MKIEKNIIKIEMEESQIVIREKKQGIDYGISMSEMDRRKSFEKKFELYSIENELSVGRAFYESCVNKGIGDCYIKVIPKFKITEGEIKVYMLIWNGKAKSVNMNNMPMRIFKGNEEVYTMILEGIQSVDSGEFELCEGFIKIPEDKIVTDDMIIKL